MAKIKISGVGYDQSNYTVLISISETVTEEGQEVEKPLGEASVRFPSDTGMDDIKAKIIDAAEKVKKASDNARDKRKDIEELELPDIT